MDGRRTAWTSKRWVQALCTWTLAGSVLAGCAGVSGPSTGPSTGTGGSPTATPAGGGSGPAAFCAAVASTQARIVGEPMPHTSRGLVGQHAQAWAGVIDTAPPELRPDVTRMVAAMDQVAEGADPGSTMASVQDATRRYRGYLSAHCH